MEPSLLQLNTQIDLPFLKLSPFTTASSLNQPPQIQSIPQITQIETQTLDKVSINNQIPKNSCQKDENFHIAFDRFQIIQRNIMQYFHSKGIVAGHPEEWKKQYHRKLHKKVSLNSEVNQAINVKAEQGSSLLSRRLKKKITILL